MVGVLMGHHDRIKVGGLGEIGDEGAGIDQYALARRLDEQAGVTEMSDAHSFGR
jgi:hypothetical protein